MKQKRMGENNFKQQQQKVTKTKSKKKKKKNNNKKQNKKKNNKKQTNNVLGFRNGVEGEHSSDCATGAVSAPLFNHIYPGENIFLPLKLNELSDYGIQTIS